MLKPDEEVARYHLCAYACAETLADKHSAPLKVHFSRIPLEPRRARKLLTLFRETLGRGSPSKAYQWSPSPKRTKNNRSSNNSAHDSDLHTPTKPELPYSSAPSTPSNIKTSNIDQSSRKTRRRLEFEEENETDIQVEYKSNVSQAHDLAAEPPTSADTITSSPRKRGRTPNNLSPAKLNKSNTNLLQKKYYKVKPSEIIKLCNEFQLPSQVAYHILDQYRISSNFLTFTWQLVCGLIIHCVFIVFYEKRKRDPRIDLLIIERMAACLNCDETEEVIDAIRVTKELVEGESWFRDLQIEYGVFEGNKYIEWMSTKLGSMLQANDILVSDEIFNNWKRKIEQDISLRK